MGNETRWSWCLYEIPSLWICLLSAFCLYVSLYQKVKVSLVGKIYFGHGWEVRVVSLMDTIMQFQFFWCSTRCIKKRYHFFFWLLHFSVWWIAVVFFLVALYLCSILLLFPLDSMFVFIFFFRLVIDRETGKPKGYGFCEYKDEETALSARRNLQGYEINGRQLRVDFAENDKNADRNREQAKLLVSLENFWYHRFTHLWNPVLLSFIFPGFL